MVDSLTRMWVLIGAHLNTRAQSRLATLLPAELSGPVQQHLRRGTGVETIAEEWGGLSAAEARVSAALRRRVRADDADGDDGDELDPEEAEDADGAGAGAEDAPDAPLVAALCSLVLLDAPRPADAARLLVELPLRVQGQAIDLIVTSSVFSASWGLEAEERALVEGMRERLTTADRWGVLPACEILRAIDTTRRLRRAISATAAIDEDAVTILQNHLFVFADVGRLNDRELQSLLNRVGNQRLACALHGAPDVVRERLLGNMSPRRARLVEEEGEYLGELDPEEIEADQLAILETLRELYERGEISTYFGSVTGEYEPTEPEGAATMEIDEDEEEDGEEEVHIRVEPVRGKKRAAAGDQGSRRRMVALLGLVVGGGLLTLGVLELAHVGDGVPGGQSQRSATPRSSPGASGDGRVLVQSGAEAPEGPGKGPAAPGSGSEEATESPQSADPGIEAILEFAGSGGGSPAQVRVEEGSQVEEESAADSSGAGAGLFLRMGSVSCAVVGDGDGFVVGSPLVAVRGMPGSVFAVRVVLDASTTVYVERGRAEVSSEQRVADPVVLTAGERRLFEP